MGNPTPALTWTRICRACFRALVFGFAALVWNSTAFSLSDREQVRSAFLGADAARPDYLALQTHPELAEDREVQMKIFRSLGSSDLSEFQTALELCLREPRYEVPAMIGRRLNLAFLSRDPARKRAILQLRGSYPKVVEDLRFRSLASSALEDEDPELSQEAWDVVRAFPDLAEWAAVAEVLHRTGKLADGAEIRLPVYNGFRERIQPMLQALGSDGKSCIDCHKTHPVLQLYGPESGPPSEEMIVRNFRSVLRVIDLKEPAQSLILKKPTLEEPAEGVPAGAENHGGGVRFRHGSAEFQTLLNWILDQQNP